MSAKVVQRHSLFFADVRGLDARAPTEALRAEVEAIMDRYAVCVLRDQKLDDDKQIAFSSLFGPLESQPGTRGNKKRSPRMEIWNVTNLDAEGNFQSDEDASRQYRIANQLWHTDSSFRQVSGKYSLLYAHQVPPIGADTQFTDTRAVYDALPEATKARLDGLVAEHSVWYSRGILGGYEPTEEERNRRPPAQHPLVRTIPGSGRRALFIASHVSRIIGWPETDSRALLDELMDFATQPRFVYAHRWNVGDLVIWDNRCTMHRATPFEDDVYVRDMRRTTTRDVAFA
ncbi:MAG TPA: TauD/TfdA family dioxygenase [Beijerinckiaceae bacterium]|nr:TauD/TfdA family dioxygenase [Beijerinckiaceae bacterium]